MGNMKWTKEQENAIYTDKCNLLVAAAAGSGKTAVLVQRIIEKILDKKRPIDIDRLLIVTFTNAAASEMKERIGEAISKELDKNPDSKNLQRQLTLLNRSNIKTIHSFCLQVIRNNFHVIDIDPNFRIGDETETLLLRQEVLEDLFESKYEDKNCSKDFLDLIDSYGGKNDFKIVEMVEDLYNFSQSIPCPDKWLNDMTEVFNVDENFKFEETSWAKILIEDFKIETLGIKAKLEKVLNIFKEYEDGLGHYVPIIEEDIRNLDDILYSNDWKHIFETFSYFKLGNLPRKKIDDSLKDIKDSALDIRNKIKDKLSKLQEDMFLGYENIEDNMKKLYPRIKCLIQLVMEFTKEYKNRKKDRNIIDFNDIEHFALEILTDFDHKENMIPSKIAIEYRMKFDEILIDEYQDSNLVQEVILNAISRQRNIDTDNEEIIIPNMFMVGDVKQSIYRFRQAKPELFLKKYDTYSENDDSLNKKIKLFKNFRSRKGIINGVNFIFKQIMCKEIGELEYGDSEKLNYAADFKDPEDTLNFAGPIEVHIMEKNTAKDEDNKNLQSTNILVEDEEELDNIQIEAKMVSKIIKNIINGENKNPYMVFDKNTKKYRRAQYKDIVILMRATSQMAPVFMEELNSLQIPVFADTSTGYFQTTEIKTIMALLQVIDNPDQDIPLMSIMRSPIFSFSSEEIIDIRLINKNISIYQCIFKIKNEELCNEEEKENVKVLDDKVKNMIKKLLFKINEWRNKSLHMSIDQFIWYLYTDTGYYGYVEAMPGGIQRQANLRLLFQRANQYENTSYRGLFNFITFINKLKNSSGDMGSAKILGENEDVVRIMSVHKSKGLEFPIVILAGIGKGFNFQDTRKSILFHHELGIGPDYVDLQKRISYPTIIKQVIKKKIKLETLSEEMRILYVAFTRAKEKLILTGMVNKLDDSIEKWCNIGNDEGNKIPNYAILEANSYLQWIMPALTRHKDGKILTDRAGLPICSNIINDDSIWNISIWDKEDLKLNNKPDKEEMNVIEQIGFLEKSTESTEYKDFIEKRLQWKYKYIEASNIPAKFSVSELKRRFSVLDNEGTELLTNRVFLKKPMFLEETRKFTSAEIGTLMHLVMQHIDIKNTNNVDDVRRQIGSMIIHEFLTEEQSKVIKYNKIFNFFKSYLGERVKKSNLVKREIPFYVEIESTCIYKNIAKDIYSGEKVMLQGIIDMYFEEGDGLVLVDYKTDFVENIHDMKNKYEIQLKYYAEALERITGKKVKEKYLYLFYCDDFIEV